MRKLTSRVLILTLIISGMLSGVSPNLKSFTTVAFTSQPVISYIDTSVHFTFGSATLGTAIILLTDADIPPILPQVAEQIVPNAGLGIYLKMTQPIIGSQIEQGIIDISSSNLPSGGDYKLEVFIMTTEKGLSSVYAADVTPKFYKATVTVPEVVSTTTNGFIAKVTSDAPGTLKAAAVNAGINPSDSDITQNVYMPAYDTPIAAGVPVVVKVTDSTINNPSMSYKVHALFSDAYGNLHKIVRSSTGVVYPDGLRILDVYYDNGVKSNLSDDRILILFNKAVSLMPDGSNFEVSFVKNAVLDANGIPVLNNGGAVDFSTGIKLNSPVHDYQVLTDNELVVLTLQNKKKDTGIQKIDDASEFDNGLMKVEITYPVGIQPQLDNNTAHWSKIIPLTHSVIEIDDNWINRLSSMTYDSKTTPLKSDDEILLTLSGDVGSDVGGTDALILDADNMSIGGFLATDVSFIRGTDYNVNSINNTQKKIVFTSTGIVKLNLLQNATLRLRLGNPVWESSTLNPAFHSLYINVFDTNTLIKEIYVGGRAIPNFSKFVYSNYEIVIPLEFKKTIGDISPFISAISDSQYALVKTQKVNNNQYKISVSSPKESSVVTDYYVTLKTDHLSVSSITLSGNIISGFDPLKTIYAVALSPGVTTPPTIGLVMENKSIDENNIVKTQSGTLPGTLIVNYTITLGGQTKVITFVFTAEPSPTPDPLAVSSITLSGNRISGFDPLKTVYSVVLSQGVTVPPTIELLMENSSINENNIIKTQSGTLPGTLTVTYTITFGGQTKVITIVFTAEPNPTLDPLSIRSITLSGNIISGFDPLKTIYAVALSQGVTSPSAIGIVMENSNINENNMVKTQSGTLPGTLTETYSITFGGQTKVITIVFTAEPTPSSTPTSDSLSVSSITLSGNVISGFDPLKTIYTVALSSGVTSPPAIEIVMENSGIEKDNIVKTQSGTLPGTLTETYSITFGGQTKVITIVFTAEPNPAPTPTPTSDPLSVSSITLNGNTISGFDPLKTIYIVALSPGVTSPPAIGIVMENSSINEDNIVKTQSGTLPGMLPVAYNITFGGQTKVITIVFTAEPPPTPKPLSISSITLSGNIISGFDPLKTIYTVALSPGVTTPPTIGFVVENTSVKEDSIVKTQSGTLPGTLPVTYTIALGGQTKVVTIVFTAEPTPTPTPTPTPNNNFGDDDEPIESGRNTPPPVDSAVQQPEDSTVQLTKTLDQIITISQDVSSVEVISQMSKVNDLLNQNIDSKQLVVVLGQLYNVLNKLSDTISKGTELSTMASEQVVKLTEAVEGMILQIENPLEALRVAESYLTSLSDLVLKSNLQSQEINKSVEDILSGINKKLGTVKIGASSVPEQPIEVQTADVQKAIDQQVAFSGTIKRLTDAFFGSTDTRRIQADIVIAISKSKDIDAVQTNLKPEIIALLKDSKVSQLSISVDGTVLSIPSENMQKNAEYIMNSKTTQQSGGSSNLEAGMPASPFKVVEFNVLENGQPKEVFAQPIELTFLLGDFGLAAVDSDFIGIYKKNEATDSWKVVGGIVDPQRGLVIVKRGSLSQYTVMKSKKSFSDSDTSWAQNEINSLLSKGVVESTTKFEPKALLTRGEFASWIAKAYGLTASNKGTPFSDLKKTDKNYEAVAAVYELGIINGKSKNKFDPNGNITADEMAVIIGKTLVLFNNKQDSEKVKSKHLNTLKSKSVASWAEGDQALLLELGISGANAFANGNEPITKETAAATFSKFYNS